MRKLDQGVSLPGCGWESVGYKPRRTTGFLGVEYRLQWRMYCRRRPDGTWEEGCPLDKQLGLAARERFSPGVQEWAGELATRHPFRVAAAILAESGTPVSHQTIHGSVQEAGAAREAEQRPAVEAIERTGEVPAGEGRPAAAVICKVDGMRVAV